MKSLFSSIFTTTDTTASSISVAQFIIIILAGLVIGGFLAWVSSYRSSNSISFIMTMFLLPAIVAVVITMVNGNIGAGVAVAGAFSLVRFRSAPGTGQEIAAIFLAMGAGLILGMGYIAFAAVYAIILGIGMIVFNVTGFGSSRNDQKVLRITVPEDLNFSNAFDSLFEKYTLSHETVSVKTSNMGSLYKLTFNVVMKDDTKEKEFMDDLRTRNGNLEISIARKEDDYNVL